MARDLTLQATIERAHELLRDGRHEENLELLEGAVGSFPDDPEIRLLYGTMLVHFRPDDAPMQLATAISGAFCEGHPGDRQPNPAVSRIRCAEGFFLGTFVVGMT